MNCPSIRICIKLCIKARPVFSLNLVLDSDIIMYKNTGMSLPYKMFVFSNMLEIVLAYNVRQKFLPLNINLYDKKKRFSRLIWMISVIDNHKSLIYIIWTLNINGSLFRQSTVWTHFQIFLICSTNSGQKLMVKTLLFLA